MANLDEIYRYVATIFTVLTVWCKDAVGTDMVDFCHSSGFSTSLVCSSCRELEQFNLQPLMETCGQCCQQDADATLAKQVYPYAQLEVCG
jgi:hypothetical protein